MRFLIILAFIGVTFINAADDKKPIKIGSHLGYPFLMLKDSTFKGFVVDFCNELSKYLGRPYELVIPPDGRYGHYNRRTRKWDGLIGDLLSGASDIIVADLTINEQRREAVNFSIPFMVTGVAILYASPKPDNLPFHNVDELVAQTEVKYGVLKQGSTFALIRGLAAQNNTFKNMVEYWEDASELLEETIDAGVERVFKENGDYAFMTEVAGFLTWKEQFPALLQVGDIFLPREFAIAMKKGSNQMSKMNEAIAHFHQNGKLTELKNKWKLKDN